MAMGAHKRCPEFLTTERYTYLRPYDADNNMLKTLDSNCLKTPFSPNTTTLFRATKRCVAKDGGKTNCPTTEKHKVIAASRNLPPDLVEKDRPPLKTRQHGGDACGTMFVIVSHACFVGEQKTNLG